MRSAPRWGFHQLSAAIATRIVADAEVQPGELVLDVGAGEGALTGPLVAAGAQVVAIELHHGRLRRLRQRFPSRQVRAIHADASDLRLPRRPFRVIANPPFAVTTALLRRLLAPGSRLVAADLVVPRHTLHRWMSDRAPGRQRWRHDYKLGVGRRVPRRQFQPPAPTDCVVLTIRRRSNGRSAG
ncbi:MAG: rRNA adenine N-6-methyltransferase family protein [Acidimicrobiales bacterium]